MAAPADPRARRQQRNLREWNVRPRTDCPGAAAETGPRYCPEITSVRPLPPRRVVCPDGRPAATLARGDLAAANADPNTERMAVPPRNTAEKIHAIYARVDDIDNK